MFFLPNCYKWTNSPRAALVFIMERSACLFFLKRLVCVHKTCTALVFGWAIKPLVMLNCFLWVELPRCGMCHPPFSVVINSRLQHAATEQSESGLLQCTLVPVPEYSKECADTLSSWLRHAWGFHASYMSLHHSSFHMVFAWFPKAVIIRLLSLNNYIQKQSVANNWRSNADPWKDLCVGLQDVWINSNMDQEAATGKRMKFPFLHHQNRRRGQFRRSLWPWDKPGVRKDCRCKRHEMQSLSMWIMDSNTRFILPTHNVRFCVSGSLHEWHMEQCWYPAVSGLWLE